MTAGRRTHGIWGAAVLLTVLSCSPERLDRPRCDAPPLAVRVVSKLDVTSLQREVTALGNSEFHSLIDELAGSLANDPTLTVLLLESIPKRLSGPDMESRRRFVFRCVADDGVAAPAAMACRELLYSQLDAFEPTLRWALYSTSESERTRSFAIRVIASRMSLWRSLLCAAFAVGFQIIDQEDSGELLEAVESAMLDAEIRAQLGPCIRELDLGPLRYLLGRLSGITKFSTRDVGIDLFWELYRPAPDEARRHLLRSIDSAGFWNERWEGVLTHVVETEPRDDVRALAILMLSRLRAADR